MNLHWMTGKEKKRIKSRRPDVVTQQVRDILTKDDQQLILMVRQ